MGRVDELPEVKLAQRLATHYSLSPPFNIEEIVKDHAHVLYKSIPIIGVDGVCLNLKKIGITPTVVVNSNLTRRRQHFTLAHELGHIIIPWHLGNIIDTIDKTSGFEDYEYLLLEQEANNFAAEILMPSNWVRNQYTSISNLKELHQHIYNICNVSYHAAAIRMIQLLPSNILYIAEEHGKVLHSGKTVNSTAILPNSGEWFDTDTYPYIKNKTSLSVASISYVWIELNTEISIKTHDTRTWREILNKIVNDINIGDQSKFKMSINGVVSSAHSNVKRKENYSVESITSACIYRLCNRPEYKKFVEHPDFENFVLARALDFFSPK